jgi:hypothetical protein
VLEGFGYTEFMKKLFFVLMVFGFVSLSNSSDNMSIDIIKNKQVNEIATLALSYSSVTMACGDKYSHDLLRSRIINLLKLANSKSSLTSDGKKIYKDVDYYILRGTKIYNSKPYVSCKEARGYTDTIVRQVDLLVGANK